MGPGALHDFWSRNGEDQKKAFRQTDDSQGVIVPEIFPGTQIARGTLLSVSCDGKEQSLSLTIQTSDGTLTFRRARSYLIGYSDTLWFGSDHFTPCHHVDGLRAVVRYKPATEKQTSGEWVELELREDLPAAPDKANAPPAAAKD
jgi:hypothetical protein